MKPKKKPEANFSQLKAKLTKAQSAASLYFHGLSGKWRAIGSETRKIQSQGVSCNEELKRSGSVVSMIRKEKLKAAEMRKSVTRIIDDIKQEWVAIEKKAILPLLKYEEEITKLNSAFITKEHEEIKALQIKIINEKNKKIDRRTEDLKEEFSRVSELVFNAAPGTDKHKRLNNECAHIELQIANITIEEELIAQSRLQCVGDIQGRRILYATISESGVDWQTIVELYIKTHGPFDLKFLLDNLIKEGQPEITGVVYKETIKNINKA